MAARERSLDFELPTAETVPWAPPVADEFSQTWWDACRERKLLVRHCATCEEFHFPPRRICPKCWSEDVSWREVSGQGTIYSYSVVRTNDLPPFNVGFAYVVGVVALDEGPRMMTTIIAAAGTAHANSSSAADLAVDVPVEVEFVDRDSWTFPAFRIR